ncbi:hypothetical protein GQX73_g4471 [Xylaria multiplex]|uniref:Uncharacterized protein n=1 Tax=Xylaria multiplex TaxID=323545 RepID=A0A7C8IPM1_9PEZI|nr:hypothetical protein GQX73_g4471 [Xylaria multiplex]
MAEPNTRLPKELPGTETVWRTTARKRGVEGLSIHDKDAFTGIGDINSASKINFRQYLLLRAISPQRKRPFEIYNCQYRHSLVSNSDFDSAVEILGKQRVWELYLKSIKQKTTADIIILGLFSFVRYYQLEVLKTEPNDKLSTPPKIEIDYTPRITRQRAAQSQQSATPTRSRPNHLSLESYAAPSRAVHTPRITRQRAAQSRQLVAPIRCRLNRLSLESYAEPSRAVHTPRITRHRATQSRQSATPIRSRLNHLPLESRAEPSPAVSTPGFRDWLSPDGPPDGSYCEGSISYKAAGDEQIVNTALILYLNALAFCCSQTPGNWTPRRKAFVLRVEAIVEVKPYTRKSKSVRIGMQEAAQMAAWIASDPPHRREGAEYSRVLISQDYEEIYIIIAKFDRDYVDYIRGKPFEKTSFLKMQAYGPFITGDYDQMSCLGHLLLAFMINRDTCFERQEQRQSDQQRVEGDIIPKSEGDTTPKSEGEDA